MLRYTVYGHGRVIAVAIMHMLWTRGRPGFITSIDLRESASKVLIDRISYDIAMIYRAECASVLAEKNRLLAHFKEHYVDRTLPFPSRPARRR